MYVGYTHARRSAKNTKIVGGVDTERIRKREENESERAGERACLALVFCAFLPFAVANNK